MPSPVTNTTDPRYWDEADLLAEQRRQYDVCHGCRLCWNLCPMFPDLFDLTDSVEGEMEQIGAERFAQTEDLCFQCKLCWVVCPYTAPHEYDLDVPRLVARAKFQRAEKNGVGLAKKLTADQDRLAKLAGGPFAPLTNFANKFPPARLMTEAALGIHRKAKLPEYRTQTFPSWFRKRYGDAMRPSGAPAGKIALFPGCTSDYSDVQIARAAVAVFERNNVEVVVPEHQCCGMPLMDAGDYKGAAKKRGYNLRRLSALVDDGCDVVSLQPTCALVLRDEYPKMSEDADAAQKVAEHTYEAGAYLVRMAREKTLKRDFERELGKVAVHVACHTRAQAAGVNSPRLLGIIPGTTVETVESCSGHDGTWGISKKHFPMALKVGEKLFTNLQKNVPDLLVSDCPLAARHIEIGTGRRPVHTMQALAAAYGLAEL